MTEAFNSGDVDIVDELVETTEDIEKTPMPGTSRDRLGLKLKIEHLRAAFPDGKFSIEEIKSDGDKVTFKWKLEGTHRGRFLGKKASNRKVSFTGQDEVTFRDGKMVEHRSLDNKGGMLRSRFE
ncbi:ester cyclase [Actinoplanes sp. NPDC051346]|uniref:ester cyclase n=1 Tax=Actinoplanes sp. NPDC051346 TaxID=3155048 RepID=UPI00341DB8C4